ncbi:hypothetical protein [Solemya velesiana gill symbiont]|uniref:Uncharacterized protein n=1 Tax=Solemya velesiana gill symbiont TaxID=1918948 RepID=A0A1T2KVQ1_9GAMM|nr:hypothetical protein [Solemya velesiana gill symbiont]OOZ36929.1 hypothetical protein BOW51_04750 [Solemya velesiana gill symbiont]
MLEYIFFDERPWNRFVGFLQEKGLSPVADHEDQGYMVRLPEDTADGLMDDIEAFYDEMLDMNEALFIEEEGAGQLHTAGVTVNLKNGRTVQAAVDPKLLNRILEVVSAEELGRLVNAIVDAVENPDDRSICQR